uniref:Uncharacterized protein n=1 Tax=Parascaris univalens TaxID=6257 RepID=A0A915BJQ9_PARUN
MDPLGFAHLRCRQGPPRLPVPNMSHKRLNNPAEQISLNKCEAISLKRLYYPVNTPMCHYQRQLVIDSLFINLLIALPNELDSFFVASVVMINFRRWFTHKKVVYVGSTADNVRRMADVFVDLTGYPRSDLCIYPTKKKSERFVDWCNCGVIFATAECLLPDLKGGSMGSDVGLVVADDAQRAASGSHPLCEIIRAFIFAKAIFRILALTDNRIKKVAPLQVIAMNLQIGCIRSQSQLRNDILQTISSFRMQEIYISITPEMEVIANGLVEAMHSVVSLLYESDLLPSNSLQRLANFSLYSMKKKVEYKAPNLVDVFCDLEDLFAIYDALMCDGITAFALCAQPIAKRSLTIQNIIESNVHIKEAFLQPDMSNTEQMCAHKLSTLLALINKALISYGSELSRGHKLVVVVLCRNRGPYYVSAVVATLRKRFVSRKREVDIIVYGKGANMAKNLSEHSLSSGKCSIILCPCDSSAVELNVGFVDVVICCDEGLSSLYYMGRIALKNEAELYALRTNGYETNICKFTSEESTKECIDANTIKGAQLCTDNPQLFPDMTIPEIVEYWSIEIDENSGMLSTMEMLAYEEKLEATGGKDLCKSVPKVSWFKSFLYL